ncbi:MAG TPA: hypothetical protein VEK11_22535 [Thermoanaerobaculia bacterium]|nr:hypothetical protein [Thermoanaerobaculia bacterium]
MRSSSIKSTVLAVTVALTLSAAAPIASAGPSKVPTGTPSVIQQFEQAATRATTAARRLLTRFFGPTSTGLPGPPLPAETTLTSPELEQSGTTAKTRKP